MLLHAANVIKRYKGNTCCWICHHSSCPHGGCSMCSMALGCRPIGLGNVHSGAGLWPSAGPSVLWRIEIISLQITSGEVEGTKSLWKNMKKLCTWLYQINPNYISTDIHLMINDSACMCCVLSVFASVVESAVQQRLQLGPMSNYQLLVARSNFSRLWDVLCSGFLNFNLQTSQRLNSFSKVCTGQWQSCRYRGCSLGYSQDSPIRGEERVEAGTLSTPTPPCQLWTLLLSFAPLWITCLSCKVQENDDSNDSHFFASH